MIDVVRTSRTICVGIAGKRVNLGLSRSNSVRKSDVDLVFLCTSFRRDPSDARLLLTMEKAWRGYLKRRHARHARIASKLNSD